MSGRRVVRIHLASRKHRVAALTPAPRVIEVDVDRWNAVVWAYRHARRSGGNAAFLRSLVWNTIRAVES